MGKGRRNFRKRAPKTVSTTGTQPGVDNDFGHGSGSTFYQGRSILLPIFALVDLSMTMLKTIFVLTCLAVIPVFVF